MKKIDTALLSSTPVAMIIIAAVITAFYGTLFGGYWLGDDFSNILLSEKLSRDGRLLAAILDYFFSGTSSAGSMYRPLQMASLLGNYAIAGDYYPGWYAFNFVLHLANATLVYHAVRLIAHRLIPSPCRKPFISPLLAALAFALAPSLAEGVFWVSARADACVTLLSLISLICWVHSMEPQREQNAWWFPVLLLPALLFKESATVLPLQMILVTLAFWPLIRRQHVAALGFSLLLVAGFFTLRWWLFGHAFGVYSEPGSADNFPTLAKFWHAIYSVNPWWQALTQKTPTLSMLYLGLTFSALVLSLTKASKFQATITVALLCAAGGLALATLLSLAGLSSSGEGGRLSYGPVCWLMLAIGVATVDPDRNAKNPRLAAILFAFSLMCAGFMLPSLISQVQLAQTTTRGISRGVSEWTSTHEGHAMLLIPERVGFVIVSRNSQAGIVLPPVQAEPLLHRVLPAIDKEISPRYSQYLNGLATNLISAPPDHFNAAVFRRIMAPAATKWPDYYQCWSGKDMEILAIATPRTDTVNNWRGDLKKALLNTCNR